jgi:Uma2 family endonuclease
VREYWLVDAEARTVEILSLDRDAFHLALAVSGGVPLDSPILGQLPITANDLFAGVES